MYEILALRGDRDGKHALACCGQGVSDVARKRDDTHRQQAAIVRMNPFNK